LRKKIQKIPLNVCFKSYTGSNDPKQASDYIEKQFLSQIRNPNKLVYTYQTCATDTKSVQFVFKAVKDVFITAYLNHLGLGIGTGAPVRTERTDETGSRKKGQTESRNLDSTSEMPPNNE